MRSSIRLGLGSLMALAFAKPAVGASVEYIDVDSKLTASAVANAAHLQSPLFIGGVHIDQLSNVRGSTSSVVPGSITRNNIPVDVNIETQHIDNCQPIPQEEQIRTTITKTRSQTITLTHSLESMSGLNIDVPLPHDVTVKASTSIKVTNGSTVVNSDSVTETQDKQYAERVAANTRFLVQITHTKFQHTQPFTATVLFDAAVAATGRAATLIGRINTQLSSFVPADERTFEVKGEIVGIEEVVSDEVFNQVPLTPAQLAQCPH